MNLAERLSDIRQAKQISKRALSKKSGVALSFICAIEAGQKNPTVRTLERLAAALDVSVADLFDPGKSA